MADWLKGIDELDPDNIKVYGTYTVPAPSKAGASSPTLKSKVASISATKTQTIVPGLTSDISSAYNLSKSPTLNSATKKNVWAEPSQAVQLPQGWENLSKQEKTKLFSAIKPSGTIQANDGNNAAMPYTEKYKLNANAMTGEAVNDYTGQGNMSAFGAGLAKPFEPLTEMISPKTQNQKWIDSELQKQNPIAYGAGQLAGNFAKFAPAYKALAPIEGVAALSAIKNPLVRTLVTEGIKDVAVATGYGTAEGMMQGKAAGDIVKDIATQIPQDILFNGIMYGAGKVLGGLSKQQIASVESEVRNVVESIARPEIKIPETRTNYQNIAKLSTLDEMIQPKSAQPLLEPQSAPSKGFSFADDTFFKQTANQADNAVAGGRKFSDGQILDMDGTKFKVIGEDAQNIHVMGENGKTFIPKDIADEYVRPVKTGRNIPMDERDFKNVGAKSVNAYQYENPEVKPFIQQRAGELRGELSSTSKGDRFPVIDQYGNNIGTVGQTKHTSETIERIQEQLRAPSGKAPTYDEIKKGLNALIEDNGKENIAIAKKIELAIHDDLMNGYRTIEGMDIPPSAEYGKLFGKVEPPQIKSYADVKPQSAPASEVVPPKVQAPELNAKVAQSANMEGLKAEPPKIHTEQTILEKVSREFKTADEIDSVIKELEADKKFMPMELQLFAEKKIAELKQRLSKFHSNIQKNEFFHEETKKKAVEGDYMYDPIVNKETYEGAQAKVKRNAEASISEFMNVKSNEATADDIATGYALIAKYQNEGNYEAAANVALKMRGMGTKAGQTVQAFSISNRLTPEGRLTYAAKEIESMRTPQQDTQIDKAIKQAQGELNKAEADTVGQIEGEISDLVKQAKEAAKGQAEAPKGAEGKPGTKAPEVEAKAPETAKVEPPKIKKGKQRAKVEKPRPEAEELLVRKIESHMKNREPKKADPIADMVATLFKVAKESPIQGGVKPKAKTDIEFIGEAMRNRSQYKEVWGKAQAIIKVKYKDKPEVLQLLKEYFENPARPTFSAKQFDSAMGKGMKELDIKISQIVKEHYSANSAARTNLVDKLVKEAGLSGAEAGELEKLIRNRMKDLTKKAKEDALERMFKAKKPANPKAYEDAIREFSNIGAFKNENYKDLVYGKISPLLDKAIKENKVDFGKLILQSAKEQNFTERQLMNKILTQVDLDGLSEADAYKLSNMIIKKFQETAKGKRASYWKRFMAESTRGEAKTLNEKIVEMVNVGGLDDPSIRNAFAQRLGIPSMNDELVRRLTEGATVLQDIDTPKAIVELIRRQADYMGIKPSKRSLKYLEEYTTGDVGKLREIAAEQMNMMVAEQVPTSFARKTSTYQVLSHLLNARTTNRNLFSNAGFAPIEKVSQAFSIPFDKAGKLFTGQRTVTAPKLLNNKHVQSQAAKDTYVAINLGISKYGDKYNTSATRTFKKGFLGWSEKMLRYSLEIPDEFTKAGRKHEALRQMTAATGMDAPTKQMIEQAEHEAAFATFQDDTLPAQMLTGIKELLNKIPIMPVSNKKIPGHVLKTTREFGIGDMLIKYTRVPGNIISRSVEYTPAGFIKAITLMARAKDSGVNQREIVLSCGRAMTGTAVIGMGALMHQMGLISGDDKRADKDKKALQKAEGKGAYKINMSAVGRLLAGEDAAAREGDQMHSFNWFMPMSIGISMGAAISDGYNRTKEAETRFRESGLSDEDVKTAMQNVKGISIEDMGNAAIETFLDLPLIGTIKSMVYADGAFDIMTTPIVEGASGFIPSVIRQTANVINPVARETYDSDSRMTTLANKLKASIPGLKNTLEPKIDSFGEEIRYDGGIVSNMLNPANVSTYTPYKEITSKLEALEKATGEVTHYPSTNLSKFMEGMSAKQKTEFKKLAGQKIKEIYASELAGVDVESLTLDEQIELVNSLKKYQTDARAWAKEQVTPKVPELSDDTISKLKAKWLK